MENKKVLLGMSGGVDSSVSALLLKQEGYEVIGTTLELFAGSSCCNISTYLDAKNVCSQIGIPHFTFNCKDEFKEHVIDDFIGCYKNCKTPNPCIECNKYMKFGIMWEKAKELGCNYIATGHYAKTEYSEEYGRWVLKKSNAGKKDQSYVLWNIPKELIEHVVFPLADFEDKLEIRKIASENELKVANNADKATDNDKVKYKYLSGVQGNISKLYKEKREIQNSNKSDKEKKEQLKNIQSKINKMAKEGMEKAEKIDTKNKNYIKVDNNQYYKDIEGNWKKVEDKDKEKNKEGNISLGTYTSYKNAIEKVKARKVKNGEMKESESLDQKEKIQILLNSKCSNSTKSALYEQYIKSKPKDGDVDIYKALKENGVDINQYLKYVQQEFKSDKKDDGTLNGKSISGSAKSKVYDYINNNISGYENRLLLLGTKYKLSTNERKKVYETINNLPNTTQEEKLKLLNKMKGFTVYKDGTVKF